MTDFYAYHQGKDPFKFELRSIQNLAGTHDLSLGAWGPYDKRYFGLSHLSKHCGARVDWTVIPELHRRRHAFPHALRESDYLPWSANADLSDYSYRQQILGKDDFYADIRFTEIDLDSRKIEITWNNRSAFARSARLHLCGSWQPSASGSWQPIRYQAVAVETRNGAHWIDALTYAEASLEVESYSGLRTDGRRQGECLRDGLVDAQGIQWPDHADGGTVSYRLPIVNCAGTFLALRYQSSSALGARLTFLGADSSITKAIHLSSSPGSGAHLSQPIAVPLDAEYVEISLVGEVDDFVLDGLLLGDVVALKQTRFIELGRQSEPDVTVIRKGLYRVEWKEPNLAYEVETVADSRVRTYEGDLENALQLSQHNHVSHLIRAPGEGCASDFISPVIQVAPGDAYTQTIRIRSLTPSQSESDSSAQTLRQTAVNTECDVATRFGVDRLAATLLTNVVYPVRVKGQTIRHYTPGRWWDSLYTWDCGFIGLGLAEIAPERSVELLNTYLTEPGDSECAFIHHGSPVPVQHYQFYDLWQKTQDRTLLQYAYPRLSQYLNYLGGVDERSPVRAFKSALLQSWDLFYNSAGWDDYPPQHYLFTEALEQRERVATMAYNSHIAATARIMARAANELGEDASPWQSLAESIRDDIERYAWDEDAKLYGYVEHDADGHPQQLLLHEPSGANYNRGLDGFLPLIAGELKPEREAALWSALKDESRFFTEIGLSTVDQTAPYYSATGYWNGAVWIPYQYIFWKAALDYGELSFAHSLAQRVLALYDREVQDAQACFEHFMIDSGRGAGWHHFGGLSAPILSLYAAYHVPGRITTGLNAWISEQSWESDASGCEFTIEAQSLSQRQSACVLVTLASGGDWLVRIDGVPVAYQQMEPGALEISLKPIDTKQCVSIRKR